MFLRLTYDIFTEILMKLSIIMMNQWVTLKDRSSLLELISTDRSMSVDNRSTTAS